MTSTTQEPLKDIHLCQADAHLQGHHADTRSDEQISWQLAMMKMNNFMKQYVRATTCHSIATFVHVHKHHWILATGNNYIGFISYESIQIKNMIALGRYFLEQALFPHPNVNTEEWYHCGRHSSISAVWSQTRGWKINEHHCSQTQPDLQWPIRKSVL